ncbi:MAG TPA: hypothetical protein VMT52_10090 [Planctomycetota bacterium]|nr:hypothetical protein [Planctomycetota bacterium]
MKSILRHRFLWICLSASSPALLAPGCGTTDWSTKDAVTKAKHVKNLQVKANAEFDRYVKSAEDPDGVDESALLRYVALHKEMTEVHGPQEAPRSYANYGAALRRLGLHYETLVTALEESLEAAPGAKQADIKARITKYTTLQLENFVQSNRYFTAYIQAIQSGGGTEDAQVYLWGLRNSQALKDWRQAIAYLDQYSTAVLLNDSQKEEVAAQRKFYQDQLRLLEEEDLRRELGDDRSSPRASAGRGAREPAN